MPSPLRPRSIFDAGSLAKVHKTCLETWLGNQAIDQCEICKFHYVTARRPKGFHEWLINSSTREDKQNLIGDMVALLLLTPLVVFSLWLCTEGAIQFSHEGFPTWESAGLVFITIVLFVVFCVWVTLLYRYHYTIWKQWRSHNFHVNLLVKSNAPPVSEEVPLPPVAQQDPETTSQGDREEVPSVVVEGVPDVRNDVDVPAERSIESPSSSPKESPPKSSSSTLIIYTEPA
ncbi:membrane-associated RING finger containing protein, putative [Ixodes scapularis]|uniref:Membrane-associated RING finger containing protein, putative n=1 Tax=Ixodes scapularis TaxID=6945 RepID=B7Q6T0_IXOSC|nr:membrane-associated RING finger containing protein, putative [Ixodes scapularis]|eukprot:XP_002412030.1 membrane-associated RING finger containing protein, putative [Ixodes scapularis]